MALAEYGIPSGIQNFSFEADYYGCINGCGNKVRVTNTMCDKCQVCIYTCFFCTLLCLRAVS